MPTYEFRCPRGHEFEKFYRTIGTAEANPDCPQCGLPAERQMSAAGFAFKGSGFYLTDYGKNAHRDKGTSDGRPAAAAEGGSESSKGDSSKGDSSKGESSKGESKTDAAPTSTSSTESKPAAEPKTREAKSADAKPAAPPKKSTGE